MSEIQEPNTHETLYETQNQNIDTQVANEEAPVQNEMPQNQDIGPQDPSTFEVAPEPGVPSTEGQETVDQVLPLDTDSEPSDIDPAVTMSSDDLVGSDPKVTMNPEDLSGPETAEEPGFLGEDISDFWDALDQNEVEGPRSDGHGWFDPNEDTFEMPVDLDVEPNSPLGSEEPLNPLLSEDYDNHGDQEADLREEDGDTTAGGYDGSGIAGGLGIDYNDDTDFAGDSDERSPDLISEQEEASEAQSEAQSNFTDAEYQEVLDDLDNGNIEDVREFLEDLAHSRGDSDDTQEEAPQHAPGDPDEDGGKKLVEEGISIDDIVGGEEKEEGKVQEGLKDGNNNTEEYIYDEEAYEDAEDALEDLQDALQDGDEEDLAEALEELQGYLGGFDKGEPEEDAPHNHGDPTEDQTGEWVAGENGDIWVDASGKIWDSPEQAKADAQLSQDEENAPHNHGDPEEVPNGVDKEAVEAPDASGAAVSGAAVSGAAVGAGAADEADVLDGLANGDIGEEALDAATDWAGDAIDEALGIEGSAEIFDDVLDGDWDGLATNLGEGVEEWTGIEGAGNVVGGVIEGDWDKVTDALPDIIGEGVEEYFGIEGAGDVVEDILEGDWDELGDHIGEAAGSFVGNVLGGPVGAAIGEEIGEFVGDGVGDAVTEELGDIADHIENGEYDELAGDALALSAGTVGGLIFGDDGAAVGQEIGEAVGDAASEVVEEVGEVVEDVGDAIGGAVDTIGDLFDW